MHLVSLRTSSPFCHSGSVDTEYKTPKMLRILLRYWGRVIAWNIFILGTSPLGQVCQWHIYTWWFGQAQASLACFFVCVLIVLEDSRTSWCLRGPCHIEQVQDHSFCWWCGNPALSSQWSELHIGFLNLDAKVVLLHSVLKVWFGYGCYPVKYACVVELPVLLFSVHSGGCIF